MVDLSSVPDDRSRALEILRAHGDDVTSFQLLAPGYRYFFEGDGFVAYVETGGAWVAGGGPVSHRARRAALARSFVGAAAARRKRASFFAVGDAFCEEAGLPHVRVGEQPWWDPARWDEVVASHASLRYQIRRAVTKGVAVRRVSAQEMTSTDSNARLAIESLARAWLDARPLAPMGFLVELAPFDFPEERLYLVAELDGVVVGFLAAAPIFARRGWLVENLLRAHDAPNGTAELLVDRAMRIAAESGSTMLTLGLAPLAGPLPRRLRMARALSTPLYDFRGLHAFKSKLRPHGWEAIHVAAPPGSSPWLALVDGLTAFARGSMIRFGLATIARGPIAVLWALTLLLTVWTPALALAPTRRFFPSPIVHHAWVAFDLALIAALMLLCRRHRTWLAIGVAVTVTLDAVVTAVEAMAFNVRHARSALDLVAIAVACAGPAIAAVALWGFVRRSTVVQP
jgi:phosphatidylglycerol lysyltransferase